MKRVGMAELVAAIAAMLISVSLWAAPPVTTKSKPGKKAATASASSHTSATAVHTRSTRPRGRASRRRAPAGPPLQMHPDTERYQQIQKALADRGYFKGEVNGQWNDDSVDALKRFQADQHLDNDGKITALTLQGLGLGPKHDGSTARLSGSAPGATETPALPPAPQENPPPPSE